MMTEKDEGDVQRALGRLEGKLDALIASASTDRRAGAALESRVQKLENWKSWIGGAVAVLGAIASWLLAHVR